ncbi:glycosyltransferase family 2 protein [Novosphingobium sp. 9U]|uniref:glycosyltransferase family 2 protein n=1 Tax=Novosphingobium sp. 9U TaxID=2653158 RepID=UPI00135AAFEE|nr:glycosyltransferase family 2 protein [Novosphingobium sp. 9U]
MSLPLSVVVPLYNEEDNVLLLYNAVSDALAPIGIDYELLLVDDGSHDATCAVAIALVGHDRHVRVLKFRRNYGQTAAMAAGIEAARGEVIVTMDGDLQNDPADIPRLLTLINQGYDIAVGWRKQREDEIARVLISKIANAIMARIMGVRIRDSGCSLKAFRAPLIQNLPMYGEMHRFIPALSQLAGARLIQIEVNHRPRQFGVSKYGFSRIYKVMLDIVSIRALLSYARRPMRWLRLPILLSLLTGLLFFVISMANEAHNSLILIGIAFCFVSLAAFLFAWGLIGQSLTIMDRQMARYATLASTMSTRLEAHLDQEAGT